MSDFLSQGVETGPQLIHRENLLTEKINTGIKTCINANLSLDERGRGWGNALQAAADKQFSAQQINSHLYPRPQDQKALFTYDQQDSNWLQQLSPELENAVQSGEVYSHAAYAIGEYFARTGYHQLSPEQLRAVVHLFPPRGVETPEQYNERINALPLENLVPGKSLDESWIMRREILDILDLEAKLEHQYILPAFGQTMHISDFTVVAANCLRMVHEAATDDGMERMKQRDVQLITSMMEQHGSVPPVKTEGKILGADSWHIRNDDSAFTSWYRFFKTWPLDQEDEALMLEKQAQGMTLAQIQEEAIRSKQFRDGLNARDGFVWHKFFRDHQTAMDPDNNFDESDNFLGGGSLQRAENMINLDEAIQMYDLLLGIRLPNRRAALQIPEIRNFLSGGPGGSPQTLGILFDQLIVRPEHAENIREKEEVEHLYEQEAHRKPDPWGFAYYYRLYKQIPQGVQLADIRGRMAQEHVLYDAENANWITQLREDMRLLRNEALGRADYNTDHAWVDVVSMIRDHVLARYSFTQLSENLMVDEFDRSEKRNALGETADVSRLYKVLLGRNSYATDKYAQRVYPIGEPLHITLQKMRSSSDFRMRKANLDQIVAEYERRKHRKPTFKEYKRFSDELNTTNVKKIIQAL